MSAIHHDPRQARALRELRGRGRKRFDLAHLALA